MQATVLLQGMYVSQAQEKLQGQENKKANSKKRTMLGDGHPKLLDGDFFNKLVETTEANKRRDTEAREARRAQKKTHSEAMAAWRINEEARKARVAEQRAAYKLEVTAWEEEWEAARVQGGSMKQPKPKLGPVEKMAPKPKRMGEGDSEDDGVESVAGMRFDSRTVNRDQTPDE